MQLSIFDLKPDSIPTIVKYPNPKKAQRLRDLAESMTNIIQEKLNPAIGNQRPTARRARIAHSIIEEGKKLQQIQSWLYAMADADDAGNLPDILAHLTTKSQLQRLQIFHCGEWADAEIQCFFDNHNGYNSSDIKRLNKAKLTSVKQVKKALKALELLDQSEPVNQVELQIKQLERELIGHKIAGYFPTPPDICQLMVKLALLEEDMRVLEPSAGKGNLSEAIQETVKVNLEVCEVNYDLRQILELKGFNIIANDCFELTSPQWHRIIANPPFGNAVEVEHIYHYYNLLISGGRMVVIVPESVEFSKKKVYKQFREWLEDKCYVNQSLPDGAFLNSDRSTGVKTRLLVIEKD